MSLWHSFKPMLWLPRSARPLQMSPGWFPCCAEEGVICDSCTGGMADQVQVNFTKVTNNDCDDCAAYYGQNFILDRVLPTVGNTYPCGYKFAENRECGCGNPDRRMLCVITVDLRIDGGIYNWLIDVAECSCCNPVTDVALLVARFRHVFGASKPPCVLASPINPVPFDTGFWGGLVCTWDDALAGCTVTAV